MRGDSKTHPTYHVAPTLCLFGVLLHILLSDPLLNALGFHYSGEEGHFYEKIHPGSLFILMAFCVLFIESQNPLRQLAYIIKHETAAIILFSSCAFLLFYIVIRSGFAGNAFMFDTHMTPSLCVITLAFAPAVLCRSFTAIFLIVAVVNSVIGIGESLLHVRLFTFDPAWSVLHEEYFRASALRGHPLNNAMFTVIALCVGLSTRYPLWLKIFISLIFMASLVAFGSRAAVLFTVAGLGYLIVYELRSVWIAKYIHIRRALMLVVGALIIAALLIGLIWFVIHSGMADRLIAAARWDKSAASRLTSFNVFDEMTLDEIFLGVPTERIMNIAYRLDLKYSLSDIENPWLLMLMYLGVLLFPLWLAATVYFVKRLLRVPSITLQLAVIGYFVVASTSNSFGRKDSTYILMVSAVICAARGCYKDYRSA